MPELSPDAPEIRVEDLAGFVTALSRFMTRLSNIPPFKQAGLGLAEWSALSMIARREGINSRQLANLLGVSAQRVNQLVDSLKRSELVGQTTSPDDARQRILTVTPEGGRRLAELNAQLHPLIAAALQSRPRSLRNASRLLRTLMRIVQAPKLHEAE
jgi:DNA-binding MarR family transcriptional regulator